MWLWSIFLLVYCCLDSVDGREPQRFIAPTCFDNANCRDSVFVSPTLAVTVTLEEELMNVLQVVNIYFNSLVPNLKSAKFRPIPSELKIFPFGDLMLMKLRASRDRRKCIKPVRVSKKETNKYSFDYKINDDGDWYDKRPLSQQDVLSTKYDLGSPIVDEEENGEDILIGLRQKKNSHSSILPIGRDLNEYIQKIVENDELIVTKTVQKFIVPIVLKYQDKSERKLTCTFVSTEFAFTFNFKLFGSFDQLEMITFRMKSLDVSFKDVHLKSDELKYISWNEYPNLILLDLRERAELFRNIQGIRFDPMLRAEVTRQSHNYHCYITLNGSHTVVDNLVSFVNKGRQTVMKSSILLTQQDLGSAFIIQGEINYQVVGEGIITNVEGDGSFSYTDVGPLHGQLHRWLDTNEEMEVDDDSVFPDVDGSIVLMETVSNMRSSVFVSHNVALTGYKNFMGWSGSKFIHFTFCILPVCDATITIRVETDSILMLPKRRVLVMILPITKVERININFLLKHVNPVSFTDNPRKFRFRHINRNDARKLEPVLQTINKIDPRNYRKNNMIQVAFKVSGSNNFEATDIDIGSPLTVVTNPEFEPVVALIVETDDQGKFNIEGVCTDFNFLNEIIQLTDGSDSSLKTYLKETADSTPSTTINYQQQQTLNFFQLFRRIDNNFHGFTTKPLDVLWEVIDLSKSINEDKDEGNLMMAEFIDKLKLLRPYFGF